MEPVAQGLVGSVLVGWQRAMNTMISGLSKADCSNKCICSTVDESLCFSAILPASKILNSEAIAQSVFSSTHFIAFLSSHFLPSYSLSLSLLSALPPPSHPSFLRQIFSSIQKFEITQKMTFDHARCKINWKYSQDIAKVRNMICLKFKKMCSIMCFHQRVFHLQQFQTLQYHSVTASALNNPCIIWSNPLGRACCRIKQAPVKWRPQGMAMVQWSSGLPC